MSRPNIWLSFGDGWAYIPSMDFDLVTRAHVERAVERLRSGEIVQGYGSSTEYDIIVDDRAYDPKQVMALACCLAPSAPKGKGPR